MDASRMLGWAESPTRLVLANIYQTKFTSLLYMSKKNQYLPEIEDTI